MNKLTVSLSPHVHGGLSVKKLMWGVVIAMIPAMLVSFYYFGLGALKVTLVAVASSVFFEYLIQKYIIKGDNTVGDGSAVITGMLLAFNVPTNLPCWIIIIGSLVSIGVGKMSFGGLGTNPFNPALVGRVFLLISFPVQMTIWPEVSKENFMAVFDATTGATPLAIIKEGVSNQTSISELMKEIPSYLDMFLGKLGGSMGEVSALAILVGGIFMLYKKIITWHIPASMIGSVVIFAGILWLIDSEKFADPLFHLVTGGMMLGIFFMATDMVTSPMTGKGMIIFGVGIGVITILIRTFGAYPEGVSFAILIMNGFVPLINNFTKPRRFGHNKNKEKK